MKCCIKKFVFSIALFLFLASSLVFANYYGKGTYGYGYYGTGAPVNDYSGGGSGSSGSPAPSTQANVTNATDDGSGASSDVATGGQGDTAPISGEEVAAPSGGSNAPEVTTGAGGVLQEEASTSRLGPSLNLGGTSIPVVAIVVVIVIAIVAFLAMRR